MTSTKGPLQNYRIIDFTDRHGVLGTRILAGLGAEVIRIEPPGGDPMRQYGPLSGDGNSFFWLQMNAAKKSVVLDLKSESGRTLLWSLLKSSDALFESGFRNDLELHGFDWGNLSAKCPELVYTTISPFGCEGPRSHWVGGDLVAMAAGGLMYLCGDQDRAPLRVSVEQASAQSSVQAMVGTLIALRACKKGAFGQRVDISMQEAITNTLGNSQATYALTKVISKRAGGGRASG
ncbi:MAG: CoA transferase [Tepidiformaceae bacterium]